MKKVFEITYTDGHHEYIKYFNMDGYCGSKKMVKVLNMIHYCGHIMSDEDYKEFVLPNRIPFEIINIDQIDIHEIKINQ